MAIGISGNFIYLCTVEITKAFLRGDPIFLPRMILRLNIATAPKICVKLRHYF